MYEAHNPTEVRRDRATNPNIADWPATRDLEADAHCSDGLQYAEQCSGRPARRDLDRNVGHPAPDTAIAKRVVEAVLVPHHICIDGYSDLSLTLASAVVKRQSTRTDSRFRRACHAATSRRIAARSGMRRSRHWPTMAPISISAMFSQLPCFGV